MSMITLDADIVSGENVIVLSNGTKINRYSHVCAGAQIGDDVMVGEHVYIAAQAIIGHRCRIQNTNNIWNGVELGDDVFIAPAVALTNHHDPRERFDHGSDFVPDKTIIGARATLGTNCSVVAPCIIGADAMIAAGSVILANVPANYRAYGIFKTSDHR